MRGWILLALLVVLGAAWAAEMVTIGVPEAGETPEVSVKIVNEAKHVEKVTYTFDGGEIVLNIVVQFPTPCYELEGVESAQTGENEYTVTVKASVEGEACIQVLPPARIAQVRIPAGEGSVTVYVREEVGEKAKELKEEEGKDICEELKERIEEAEKRDPELAAELRLRYESQCLAYDRCARIREELQKVQQLVAQGEEGLKEKVEELQRELLRCEAGPQPVERAPVVEGEGDPCKLAVMYKKLAEQGSEAAKEAAERYEEMCREHEPEDVEEAINKAVAVGKDVREEIEKIKEAIKEIREQIRETREAIRIVAKRLAETVKVEKGKIVVGGAEINVPAEIVVDENKGLALKVEGTEIVLTAKQVKVKVRAPVEVTPEGNVLSDISKKPIRVDPEEVVEKAKSFVEEIREMLLEDDGEAPKYVVEGEDEGRLLGIIPVKIQVRAEIRADNGEVLRIDRPWWAFLVFG